MNHTNRYYKSYIDRLILYIEHFLKILIRSLPVMIIFLTVIALGSLKTWGNDQEFSEFTFEPLISILLTNLQVLNIKLRLLFYSGKPLFRWCFYGIVHILVMYLVFSQTTVLMMSVLEEHEYYKVIGYQLLDITEVKPFIAKVRFPGEDVEFRCKTHLNDKYKSVWKHNGLAVKESWRHRIGSALQPENITTLSITLIDEDDFGEYSCWSYVHMNHRIYEFKTKEFMLVQRPPLEFDPKIPLSGIFTTIIPYISYVQRGEEDEDELEFIHMIDSQEKSHLCSEKDSSYIFYFYRRYHKLLFTDNLIRHVHIGDVSAFHSMISMCPQAFGVHTFSVFRRIYNNTSNRWVIAEIDLPIKFNITPKRSPFLAHFINTTNSREYHSGSRDFLTEHAFVIHSLEVIFICFVLYLCKRVTSTVINNIIDPLLSATLTYVLNKLIVHYCYAKGEKETTPVYLACEETDAPWCSTVLSPVFESLGHDTYIPLRDTRGGQGELEGIREGMDRCSRCVIVVSENEKDASPLWKHEVEVILDRSVRGELQEYNILIVSLNHASYSPVDKVRRVKEITCLELCKDISPNDRSLNGVIRWLLSSKANYLLQN